MVSATSSSVSSHSTRKQDQQNSLAANRDDQSKTQLDQSYTQAQDTSTTTTTNQLQPSYQLQQTTSDTQSSSHAQDNISTQQNNNQLLMSRQNNTQELLSQHDESQHNDTQLGTGQQSNVQQLLGRQSNVQQLLGQQSNVQQLLGQQSNVQQLLSQQSSAQQQLPVLVQQEGEKSIGAGAGYTVQSREINFSNLNADSPMSAFGADAYHSETRKVSSVVIESRVIGDSPDMQDRVRYVEVPTIEEQVKYVTVHEKREVEKRVSKPEIVWVDRVVEVEKIEWVDVPPKEKKHVERIIENKVPYTVERIREVPRPVKVIKPRYIEQEKKVDGDIIEVPVYHDEMKEIQVPRYIDRETPVVVAQTIKPIITESSRTLAVDVLEYEPKVNTINVHIAKPVSSALEVVGQRDVRHRLVNITSGQYNTILKQLNAHMDENMRQCLPYVADGGRVAFVSEQDAHFIVAPDNIQVEGWNRSKAEVGTRQVIPSLHSNTYLESQHANQAACCNTRTNKKSAITEAETTARGASSIYQQPSALQTNPISGTTTRLGGTQSSHRNASGSKSHNHSHVHTEHSGVYTENVGDEQVRQDGSTVLSHRPQQRSRICC